MFVTEEGKEERGVCELCVFVDGVIWYNWSSLCLCEAY